VLGLQHTTTLKGERYTCVPHPHAYGGPKHAQSIPLHPFAKQNTGENHPKSVVKSMEPNSAFNARQTGSIDRRESLSRKLRLGEEREMDSEKSRHAKKVPRETSNAQIMIMLNPMTLMLDPEVGDRKALFLEKSPLVFSPIVFFLLRQYNSGCIPTMYICLWS
jgi:hypothetical protein